MINELIQQMGGRERLAKLVTQYDEDGYCDVQDDEVIAALRALLAVLDGQGKPFGCDSCGGNGAVAIDHGEMGVEHMECPKCLKRSPAPGGE